MDVAAAATMAVNAGLGLEELSGAHFGQSNAIATVFRPPL